MEQLKKERPLWVGVLFILLGIFGLYFRGDWIVEGAMFVASSLGLSESTIFYILLVLGVSSLIGPLPFHPGSMIDLIEVLVASVTMVVCVYTGKGRQISRFEGGLMVGMYVVDLLWVLGAGF